MSSKPSSTLRVDLILNKSIVAQSPFTENVSREGIQNLNLSSLDLGSKLRGKSPKTLALWCDVVNTPSQHDPSSYHANPVWLKLVRYDCELIHMYPRADVDT
ncbi:hypothetical protein TNCV_1510021 [Trichonephila clavipes]|nr:hypothetical protein TNCV_1510021 [Trichonephila clavipes]